MMIKEVISSRPTWIGALTQDTDEFVLVVPVGIAGFSFETIETNR